VDLDLRAWLTAIENAGELFRIDGADVDSEIGAITDIAMEQIGRPALLFDKVPGFAPGHRVLSNALTSRSRVAITLGLDPDLGKMDLVKACRGFSASVLQAIEPVVVSSGPVADRVLRKGEFNLLEYPAPKWHEEDGGGYLGTGCVVVERDPDSGWINLGCYRLMVHDDHRLGLMISAGKQGRIIMEKYWSRGESCPVAVSFGHHPLLLMMAGLHAPYGVGEYGLAGGIAGTPVEVILGEATGLPIPARAELVMEGFVSPNERLPEGPFGEWTGYYAGGRRPEPVLEVTRVYQRDNPIVLGVVPGKPPSDDTYMSSYQTSAAIWRELEAAGIPGVAGVWGHEAGGSRMFVAVSIKQQYPGHAKQAGMIAAHCYAGAYLNKFVVVVDEDIDPTSLDDVVWAMCTRVEATVDVDVLTRSWSSPLDPMAFPADHPMFTSKTVIDACIPWDRRQSFPHVAAATAELRSRTLATWGGRLPFLRTAGGRQ
jgi:4-hydroxy-3-polyprenylbenzoate decarboxylase